MGIDWHHTQCLKELRVHGGSESCPNFRKPLPPGPQEAFDGAARLLVRADKTKIKDNAAADSLYKKTPRNCFDRRCVNEDPLFISTHSNLGVLLTRQEGDSEGAVATYKRAIAINPNHAHSHCGLGVYSTRKVTTQVPSLRTREPSPSTPITH